MAIRIPPGVFDILPQNPKEPWKSAYLWQYVEEIARKTARDFGFQEVRTPIVERTELFQRGVGESSDIVTKEMYTFMDKGDRSLSLRPEATAPVMRSYIENHLNQQAPYHKFFYIGPMFRYERSQAGRYRQHHQFGAEAIGIKGPEQDVELIALLYTFYSRLGLKNLGVMINSIGDSESRAKFRKRLKEYLLGHFDHLSEDSQRRFETNPLRILDSKDPKDQEIIANAPSILDDLSEESCQHFEEVKRHLDVLNIPYQVNPKLVRGLDYYTQTVFEVVAHELGAQNSIGAGGRYDGLVKMLGGPDAPAVGFGAGLERIIQTMLGQEVSLPHPFRPILFMIPLGDEAKETCFKMTQELRELGIPIQLDYTGRKLNKVMQVADQSGAHFVAVVGEEELKNGEVELKEMATGLKIKAPLLHLSRILKIEMQHEEFVTMWGELMTPFKYPGESEFFLRRINDSISETNKLSKSLQEAVEEINTLLKEE